MPNNGGGSGSPAAEHWRRFVLSYVVGVQKEAQEFQVKRARKMWGRLGQVLQKNRWAIIYRLTNFVPVFVVSLVKRWARISAP